MNEREVGKGKSGFCCLLYNRLGESVMLVHIVEEREDYWVVERVAGSGATTEGEKCKFHKAEWTRG